VGRAIFIFALVAIAAACSTQNNNSNPSTIRDTTGAVFGWRCDDSGCNIVAIDGTPSLAACGPGTHYGYVIDRFIAVCPCCSLNGSMCRVVACDTTSDCPQWQGDAYECRAGLCQRQGMTGDRFDADDVIELCLASTPRAANCDPAPAMPTDPAIQQAEAAALSQCGTAGGDGGATQNGCAVPASCRQP
jgi:hypothetical protein